MTDTLLDMIADWGVLLLFGVVLVGCIGIPMPSSIMMIAAGGFVASGDLSLALVIIACVAGAALGDHTGYAVGRAGGRRRLAAWGERFGAIGKARTFLLKRGPVAVFLSRWLFSPIGPYMNLAAGATPVAWPVFAIWDLAGLIVWIGIYLSLGFFFTGTLEDASSQAQNVLGFIGAGLVAVAIIWWLVARVRAGREDEANAAGSTAKPADG